MFAQSGRPQTQGVLSLKSRSPKVSSRGTSGAHRHHTQQSGAVTRGGGTNEASRGDRNGKRAQGWVRLAPLGRLRTELERDGQYRALGNLQGGDWPDVHLVIASDVD